MSEKIDPNEGTGANGKKFRKLDTVAGYDGLSENEIVGAAAVADGSMQDKVEFIFELMCTMRFQTHRTAKELANCWGVSVGYARQLCGDAYRAFGLLARHERSPDEIRAEINLKYENLTRRALENKKAVILKDADGEQYVEYVDAPDIKAAITAQKAYAELNAAHRNAVVEANRNKYLEEDKALPELLGELEKLREEEDKTDAED